MQLDENVKLNLILLTDGGWPHFYEPPESNKEKGIRASERMAKEYYTFLILLLNGDIVKSLSGPEVEEILDELICDNCLEDYEKDIIPACMQRR